MPTFHVAHLGTNDSENSLNISAGDPEAALSAAIEAASRAGGIYSVWDPEDPMGMPLVGRTVEA